MSESSQDPSAVPVYEAEALLGPTCEARIRLGDQEYVLRKTRSGKLILTK